MTQNTKDAVVLVACVALAVATVVALHATGLAKSMPPGVVGIVAAGLWMFVWVMYRLKVDKT